VNRRPPDEFLGSDRFDLPVFFARHGPSSVPDMPNLVFAVVGRDAVAAARRRACLCGSAI
jgi:hypothetical protein